MSGKLIYEESSISIQMFDEGEYFYYPRVYFKGMEKSLGVEETLSQKFYELNKKRAMSGTYESLDDFKKIMNKEGIDIEGKDVVAVSGRGETVGFVRTFMIHNFLKNGEMVYKIREKKVRYLKDVSLDIPASLFIIPFKSFMISLPNTSLEAEFGSILNIFVSEEIINESIDSYTSSDVLGIIKNNNIKRRIRCLGVMFSGVEPVRLKCIHYQMPIIEDRSAREQFDDLMKLYNGEDKDAIIKMFGFVLTFCAYLSTTDPDVEKVLGIKHKIPENKFLRIIERNKVRSESYDYFDVGKIYDTKYDEGEYSTNASGYKIFKRFKVRTHFRAQWYGPKTDNKPGSLQKIIIIQEFVKGSADAPFKPKMTELI